MWPLLIVSFALTSVSVQPQAPAPEALRARVEFLHDHQESPVGGVRLAYPDAVSHFFEARKFTPAWDARAIDEILDAIRAIAADGLTPADYHLAAIDRLRAGRTSPEQQADLQVVLTDALAGLLDHVRFGKVRPADLDRRWNVDPREGSAPIEARLAEVADSGSVAAAIEAQRPSHFIYEGLKRALAQHRAAVAAGGWPAVPAGPTLKPGVIDPRIVAVRKRLAASGDFSGAADGAEYDEALAEAVKAFQERHRLTPDAAIGRATLAAMNVTAAERVSQVRVNLERSRWVLGGLSDTFVLVNLPAFKVYVIRDRKLAWESRTQIGRIGRQTPAFRSDMRYLVLNPDWTVPPTILAQDVLAPMRKGQDAIKRKGLTIIDRQGRVVSPASIDWSTATPSNFPYVLRQAPGPNNALGRVKFIFPNEHTIFLHDTPSQELFSADERTFSSGCIRVEHALDLAALLLEGQAGWDAARIEATVASGRTETVHFDRPLPVLIVYWTVSVGASGTLRYAADIYRRDPAVLRALDAPVRPQAPPRIGR